MSLRGIGFILVSLSAIAVRADYHGLIATSDGLTVYFSSSQTPSVTNSFVARMAADGTIGVTAAGANIVDVSRTGDWILRTSDFPIVRVSPCSSNLGDCFSAAPCQASFSLTGTTAGYQFDQTDWVTFARLNGSGSVFWILQPNYCLDSHITPLPPFLLPQIAAGLHSTLWNNLLVAAAPSDGSVQLANARLGRRAISDSEQALVLSGGQLQWLGAGPQSGFTQLAGAYEAVTDASGDNVVYVDTLGGLHWISGAVDQALGFQGSAPALTEDGHTLLFLDQSQALRAYSLGTGALTRLGTDSYSEFTVAGNAAVFALTVGGRLDRIDLASFSLATWLQPFGIESTSILPVPTPPNAGPFYYVAPEPTLITGPGEAVEFRGQGVDATGWQVTMVSPAGDTRVMNLHPTSANSGWFQIPSDIATPQALLQFLPWNQPALTYTIQTSVSAGAYYCFALLHENYDRPVTASDPAGIGEIVHYYLSGLVGAEPVADETPNPSDQAIAVANPPQLVEPPVYNVLFFGLAPGAVGVQRLDVQVNQMPGQKGLFVNGPRSCAAPPVG